MRKGLFASAMALAVTPALAQYSVIAAETAAGSVGGNTSLYGGLQRYDFASAGGSAALGTGIAASQLNDPVGLRFSGGNLFVGNRHGNTLGTGSIQGFAWDGSNLSGGSTLATAASSAHQGFHGLDVAPNGDLFVSTVNGGTRRFRDSGSGFQDIGGTSSGSVRDVLIAPDGSKMYETLLNGSIMITEIQANGFGTSSTFAVGGAGAMHQMTWMGGSIFVTSFNTSSVHQVMVDANYNLTSSNAVATYNGAIGVTFSPDGQEMYVSSHTGNSIGRFMNNSGSWVANGSIQTGHNMGYLATVPEPGTFVAMGLGLAAIALRRRKK
ncbi:MAG TPA: PEP-CTERM sorting domain-containing protein [Fimbriimonadaceae bacterium]|nr:PEP-CTERM sorting domain-containing protein [Fimbriimonadaceae bacterium]